jgi:hypothetical protein
VRADGKHKRLVRLTVRTPLFHGGDAGSNPARVNFGGQERNSGKKISRDEGLRAPACFGNTCKLVRFQSSRLAKYGATTLGGPTEARRSDEAKTVVRLHPERFFVLLLARDKVSRMTRLKQSHDRLRGRGVTAAQQTFNLRGVGSNPSGPTWTCTRDQGVSGSMPGS